MDTQGNDGGRGISPSYRQLLRENPDLRRLWYGQMVSQIGDWFSAVAVIALLIELGGTRSGTAVALYALARHVPLFLLGPAAGVAADRLDRRQLLIAADLIRAVLSLGYLVVWAIGQSWLLYLVTAALAGVSIFFNSARSAMLPSLTSGPRLMVANALSAATFGTSMAMGSLLGGLLSALVGRAPAFLLNAASFLISAMFIARVRVPARIAIPSPPAARHKSIAGDLRIGIRAIRCRPTLLGLVLVPAGWALGTGAARILYSLYGAALGQETASGWVRHPRDFGIAVLYAAMGAGTVLGAALARRLAASPRPLLMRIVPRALLIDGLALIALSFSGNLLLAAVILIAREVGYTVWWTSQQTLVMILAPDAVRGRVFAAQDTLTTLALILAMLAGGPIIDRGGLSAVAMGAGAIIAGVAVIFGLWVWRSAAGDSSGSSAGVLEG